MHKAVEMMSYSFLQIWLIFSGVFHVVYKVASGRLEKIHVAIREERSSFAGAYRKASHCIELLSGGSSQSQGTRNRMNLAAGGDQIRGLR